MRLRPRYPLLFLLSLMVACLLWFGLARQRQGNVSVQVIRAPLKLVNLPPKVNDILQITQLITVFEVYDTEDEALATF